MKINEKEAGVGPFKKKFKFAITIGGWGREQFKMYFLNCELILPRRASCKLWQFSMTAIAADTSHTSFLT